MVGGDDRRPKKEERVIELGERDVAETKTGGRWGGREERRPKNDGRLIELGERGSAQKKMGG